MAKEVKCALCGETYYGFVVEALAERDDITTTEERDKINGGWKLVPITIHLPARKGYKVTPLQQLAGHWREKHPNVPWEKVRQNRRNRREMGNPKLRLTIYETLKELEKQSMARTGMRWVHLKDLYRQVKKTHKYLSVESFHHELEFYKFLEYDRCSSAVADTVRYGIPTTDGYYCLVRTKQKEK